ncbi:MAG: glycosyltransferase [Lacrimispora sp.]|uniref:glycosyltransferase n=1 Tax=Lacrimispora sp. TaxID=2719234 RepID=UPI0039E2DA81
MAKVSIVLPTFNGEKYIRESIDSILGQSFQDWELIVVDDCSSDNTAVVIREYAKKDQRIQMIQNVQNQKLPKSLNIGFKKAKGDYLTWTSDDNIFLADAIKSMVEYLDHNSKEYMVRADMYLIDEHSQIIGKSETFLLDDLYLYNLIGACFLYRREVLSTVGDYNADLFGVEDYDYWLRIYEQYNTIGHISQPLYLYRYHTQSLSNQKRMLIAKHRTNMRLNHFSYISKDLNKRIDKLVEIYCQMLESGLSQSQIPENLYELVPLLKGDFAGSCDMPYIVYGAGNYGDRVYELLGDKIAYYADSDPDKEGRKKNGVTIISIKELSEKLAKYQILIAVSAEKMWEVLLKLDTYGIKKICTYQLFLSEMNMNGGKT